MLNMLTFVNVIKVHLNSACLDKGQFRSAYVLQIRQVVFSICV